MGRFTKFLLNETIKKFDTFTQAYVDAALWSSTDDDDEPLDKNYNVDNITTDTIKKMKADCQKFQEEAGKLYSDGGWDDSQAGHDFWLTRNGHGAGFWDRTEKEGYDKTAGKKLTDMAKEYGEFDLLVDKENETIHS